MPQILKAAAEEYDRMQAELYSLKNHLLATRKELSQALYQHEAACYTVRRLMLENESLKGKLASTD